MELSRNITCTYSLYTHTHIYMHSYYLYSIFKKCVNINRMKNLFY